MADDLRANLTDILANAADAQRSWQGVLDCGLLADAVIRELEADYILVPKGHTIARIRSAEKLGLTGDGA